MMAQIALTGKAFDRSRAPYQDFALLMDVRNALVHHKPATWWKVEGHDESKLRPGVRLAVVRGLHAKRVSVDALQSEESIEGDPERYPLIDLVSTRAAARWACDNATADIAQAIFSVVPEGLCRWILDGICSTSFQRVAGTTGAQGRR
jgi:hypothetical protein